MNLILLVLLSCVALVLMLIKFSVKLPKDHPPGPKRLPIFGSYLYLLWIDYKRPYISLMKLMKHYGTPVISFGMGKHNVIVAGTYETVKEVFNNPDIQGRMGGYPGRLRTFGKKNGFFNNDGDDWLHLKRQTMKSMRDIGFGRRWANLETVLNEEMAAFLERLDRTKGEPTVIPEIFFPSVFNMIMYLLHGVRLPKEDNDKLVALGEAAATIITSTDTTGRLLALYPIYGTFFPQKSGKTDISKSAAHVADIVQKSLARHQDDFDEEALRDLMDYYVKEKEEFPAWTEHNLTAATMDMTFPNAALSMALAYACVFIAEHPDVMKKCQKEIDDVVGRGRFPTLDDRQGLALVEASIKESFRFHTLAPLGIAHRATEDTTIGGYKVPQGTMVITNLWAMHMDPNVWDEPEKFKPERFLEPGFKDKTLPFGLGRRVCLGDTYARQNIFVMLATILQNFDIEIATPLDPSRYTHGLAVAPNKDLSVRFKPRGILKHCDNSPGFRH